MIESYGARCLNLEPSTIRAGICSSYSNFSKQEYPGRRDLGFKVRGYGGIVKLPLVNPEPSIWILWGFGNTHAAVELTSHVSFLALWLKVYDLVVSQNEGTPI